MTATISIKIKGWTPVLDFMVEKYGIVTAIVYGRVWRYCQGDSEACTAAMDTIAKELELGRTTIYRHLKTLEDDGYIKDLTPDVRNRPHIYMDTGKAVIEGEAYAVDKKNGGVSQRNTYDEDGVSEENTGVSQRNSTVSQRNMKRQVKKQEIKQIEGESSPDFQEDESSDTSLDSQEPIELSFEERMFLQIEFLQDCDAINNPKPKTFVPPPPPPPKPKRTNGFPVDMWTLINAFLKASGLTFYESGRALYYKQGKMLIERNTTESEVTAACGLMRERGLAIKNIGSILWAIDEIRANNPAPAATIAVPVAGGGTMQVRPEALAARVKPFDVNEVLANLGSA